MKTSDDNGFACCYDNIGCHCDFPVTHSELKCLHVRHDFLYLQFVSLVFPECRGVRIRGQHSVHRGTLGSVLPLWTGSKCLTLFTVTLVWMLSSLQLLEMWSAQASGWKCWNLSSLFFFYLPLRFENKIVGENRFTVKSVPLTLLDTWDFFFLPNQYWNKLDFASVLVSSIGEIIRISRKFFRSSPPVLEWHKSWSCYRF